MPFVTVLTRPNNDKMHNTIPHNYATMHNKNCTIPYEFINVETNSIYTKLYDIKAN